ncbi:MAG TPA: hypothetical protein VFE51_21445 [Verrucomicrobiae bacterium]|nr:hypothetical protein [Verrucomicrobiae bacterium]
MNHKSSIHHSKACQKTWPVIALFLAWSSKLALPQGCIPAHYISLNLDAQGISYLNPGQWEADVSYRYLHSERVFSGSDEQPQLHGVGGRNTIHSFDVTGTYEISSLFSASLTIPFLHDEFSLPNDDGQRHSGSSGGLGDARLIGNAWLFKPADHPHGNVNLGLGVKFPTGDDRATSDYYTTAGQPVLRPVDIAAQPGDGGWGIFLELQGFQQIVENLYAYVSGFYLINPRDTNGTEKPSPLSKAVNSVPDQYLGRAGLSYAIWPKAGLSLTLGGRVDGVPTEDAIGGSDGFRRAGYAVYVDPGVDWVFGKNILGINVPVAVERNLQPTPYLDHGVTKLSSAGAFADFIVVASFSHKF